MGNQEIDQLKFIALFATMTFLANCVSQYIKKSSILFLWQFRSNTKNSSYTLVLIPSLTFKGSRLHPYHSLGPPALSLKKFHKN